MNSQLLKEALKLTRSKKLAWRKVGPDQYFADDGLRHFVLNRMVQLYGPDAGTFFTLSVFTGSISCSGFSCVDKDRSLISRGIDGDSEVKEIYDLVQGQFNHLTAC